MRVLIIDDEESIRKTAAVLLEEMGHEAVGVGSRAALPGRNLIARILTWRFSTCGWTAKTAWTCASRFAEGSNSQLGVVIFTAYASIETAVEAMKRGAADYLPKPFTPEQVRQVIRKITTKRKLEDRVADLESRLSTDTPNADLTTSEASVQRALNFGLQSRRVVGHHHDPG